MNAPSAFLSRRWNGTAWFAAVAGGWFWLWWKLAGEWRLGENYRYGFSVPLLLAVLVWLRLPDRSEPIPQPNPRPSRTPVFAGLLFIFLAQLIRELDPLWRLIHWLTAAGATCLTLAWLDRLGGAALRRRMAFPLVFAWTALPWPMGIEVPLGNFLMRVVAAFATDALNLAGVAALQRGNLIEMKNGVLGVDTACSGIQSLQAGFMVTLFLGDFLGLSRNRRAGLVGIGIACALAGNFARTLTLAWIMGAHGEAAETRLHDATGYAATTAIFGLIALAAWCLRPRGHRRDGPASAPSPRLALGARGRAGLPVALLLLAAPFLAWGWFAIRGGALHIQAAPLWQVAARPPPPGWSARAEPIPPATLGMLMCTSSRSVAFRTDDTIPGEITHLFWKPGEFMPSLGYSHTPEICMLSAGWELKEGPIPVSFEVEGHPLPGALFRFLLDGRAIVVFHAVWHGGEARPPHPLPVALAGRVDRLQQLWEGRRNRGHETLTLALPALPTEKATREAVARMLGAMVIPSSSPAPADAHNSADAEPPADHRHLTLEPSPTNPPINK